jgi:hypothetical protein
MADTPVNTPLTSGVTISTQINAAAQKAAVLSKTLQAGKFNTAELKQDGFFHFVIYGETSTRKTTTAAQFGSPENTRIILTRRKEQMIPLRELGYEVCLVTNSDDLLFALQYPEKIWPEWASLPDRTLILDDCTEAVEMVLDGSESTDGRAKYKDMSNDMSAAIHIALSKPMHFGMTCMAKTKDNPISNEERIGPSLPPSLLERIIGDFEFVFYIKPSTWRLVTDRDSFTFEDTDPKNPNKVKMFRREIFAKNKCGLGKNVLLKEEEMNLRKIWDKIKGAK